ncbi:hypothetical protein OHA40_25720 [Nocardia sp. NBC_00508]|uniref:hypothetical protein n=1 Tax=Nocardia sp. NBC_00508 TaxID=2975992 RepID=UPI002E8043B0|nr:hypothetical protein [Nocardia sp. NBC_00508]WUD65033.1 hypothetical protein OHA40_25720 [Nocardia sp. NBC_00508]
MGDTKSLYEINNVLDQFADKVKEIRSQPAKVEVAFNEAAAAMAIYEGQAFGGPIGAAIGAAYGAITHDNFSGYMQDHKEEIKAKIRDLLDKLHDAIEGLRAPIAFLQTSEEWLKLKSKIGEAQNNEVVKGNVLGYWQGGAANRYGAARTLQDTAMDSAKATCDKLSDCLAAISDSAWEFYSGILQDIIGFLARFTAAVAKIGSFFEAPWGISDAIDALADIIPKTVRYGDKLATALRTQINNLAKMTESTDNQKAFLNNRWPESTSKSFDTHAPGTEWVAT